MSTKGESVARLDVSVYIIGRNCSCTLAMALDSVYAQTVPVNQVIYVDDASTDESVAVATRYVERGLRVLRNAVRLGIPSSRNRAVKECRGQWIAVLDADDRWDATKMARQAAYLSEHPHVGVLGAFARLMDENGTPCGIVMPPTTDGEIKRNELIHNCFVHSTIVFRKDQFQAVGGYSLLPAAEDYDLLLKLSEITSVANLAELLTDYRIGTHSASVTDRKALILAMAHSSAAARNRRGVPVESISRSKAALHRMVLSTISVHPGIHWGVHQMILGKPDYGRLLLRKAQKSGLYCMLLATLFLLVPNALYKLFAPGPIARARVSPSA